MAPARPRRRRRLALARAVVFVAWAASALAQAQPHAHGETGAWRDVPVPTIQDAMMRWTRSGDRTLRHGGESVHMTVDVTLAHPGLYLAGDQRVPAEVASGHDLVFFLTENVHFGELTGPPAEFRLYVDDRGPFAPADVTLTNPDPHHRTHRIVFRDPTGAALVAADTASLALSAVGGTQPLVLAWNLAAELERAPDLNLAAARVVRVLVDERGFVPGELELEAGRPVILVFDNPTNDEHHFHVGGLPIGDSLRWLVVAQGVGFGDDALRAATQFDHHICDSEFGYCPTGSWVHLHANPGGRDAIAFVPQATGRFVVSCPIHEEMHAVLTVVPRAHAGH